MGIFIPRINWRHPYQPDIFLSDKFAYLISYVESKAKPPSAPNVVIWVFCQGKNAVSPTWPDDMGVCLGKKIRITHVIHYHTFCAHKSDMCLKAMLVSHMQNDHVRYDKNFYPMQKHGKSWAGLQIYYPTSFSS